MDKNQLYFGDNLPTLRQYIADESVDLIYLDPPFNSNASYNVLFAEHDGTQAASQIKAFHDTWHWDQAAASAYEEFVVTAPHGASQALQAFRTLLGCNDMLAYLSMMAPRLVELHRVLKPTGSLYLHCDPTASHYLKVLLDSIFGKENFRNEVVWKRVHTVKGNFGQGSRFFGPNTDSLFFYTKTNCYTFNFMFNDYSEEYVRQFYKFTEPDGRRYRLISMIGPGGAARGNPFYEFLGVLRCWRYSRNSMNKLLEQGLIVQMKPGAVPQRKQYLDQGKGVAIQSLWEDIEALSASAKERLGYPTQKPEALLERIVKASSNEGDLVLDPFCGCGTAIAVARRLNRRWIGIDITHLAIALIKTRLKDAYGSEITKTYKVISEPVALPDAVALADHDRYQFQYWALGLLGARPIQSEQKKGADKGVDGRLYFHDDRESGKVKQVIFSVKSGHLKNEHIRELPGILAREQAQIGVLITLESPTKPMRTEAASSGFYQSPWGTKHPKVQILTIEDILAGKQVDLPPSRDIRTFKKAPKAKKGRPDYCQMSLISHDEEDQSSLLPSEQFEIEADIED